MSDYRFGVDDYRLNIYPPEAFDGCGGFDIDKVERVEIEQVDFVRERTCHVVKETTTLRSFVHGNVEVTDERCSECGGFMDVCCGVIRNFCPKCGAKVVER